MLGHIMIKTQDIVREIVFGDEEALTSLARGYMNLSAYAEIIRREVERRTKKDVGVPSIVVALSRLRKTLCKRHPLIQDIEINNIITKSPLSEIVFGKTPDLLRKLASLHEKVKTTNDDFLTMTLSTSELTVICSDRIKPAVLAHFKAKPQMNVSGLASIGLTLDPKYYPLPNITFSLIRRIAQKRIPLAETITTRTEVIFVFGQQHLAQIVSLFETA